MSADEPPQTGGLTPPANPENSLDELLDSVRDHLDEPPVADDDIPLLTDIVVAAQPATIDETTLETPESQPDLGESVSTDDAFSLQGLDIDHQSEEEFDVTQVASLTDDLDQSLVPRATENTTPTVADAGQGQTQRSESQTGDSELTSEPESVDPTQWDDDDSEEFDVTQVASMADEPSDIQPVTTNPATGDITASEITASGPALADDQNEDGMQQTLVNSSGFEYSANVESSSLEQAANSTQKASFDDTATGGEWLDRFDRLIDERCQALATELKQQLRASVEAIDPDANHDLSN